MQIVSFGNVEVCFLSVSFRNVEVCFLGKIRQLFQNGAFTSMQIVDMNTVSTLSIQRDRPDQTV